MSSFKAFLCSIDGTYNFPLLPKVTTIGRDNCDIIINSPNIDSQHAVIEYGENEGNFVIQDLNTVNGTYINDCRVQNAAIRLAEQDVIRFGFNGMPFQFIIQGQNIQTTSMPPINMSRSNGNQTLQLINQTIPSRYSALSNNQNTNSSIWINIPATNAQLITSNNYQNNSQINCESNVSLAALKAPASLRTRPTSATGFRKITKEINTTTNNVTNTNNHHHPQLNGWIKGNSNSNVHLNELKLNMSLDLEPINTGTNDSEMHNRLFQLEKELKMKTTEVKELNERIIQMQTQYSQQTTITNTNQNGSKDSPKNELEQVKRDKSIATGLINTMQKDLSTKDATISKLAREIESLKKEIADKDGRIVELNEKLGAFKDTKKSDEEKQNKEKELLVLKTKIKTAEGKIVDLNNTVLQIKGELEESQRLLLKNSQNEKNLKDELEHVKNQFLDMQRAERIVRIDLEQAKRQYEKFRNLIIQTLFSTPGIAQPTGDVADEDLISIWKKIIDERTKLNEKFESLKEKLKENESKHSESSNDVKHIENKLILIQTNLNKCSGRSSTELVDALNELEKLKVHDSLTKIRTVVCEIIRHNLSIVSEIESSLKFLNIDVDNNFGLSVLMKSIKDRLELHEVQKASIQKQLEEAEIRHSQQMDTTSNEMLIKYEQLLEKRTTEINEKHASEISAITKEHDEKFNSFLNSSTQSQTEVALELSVAKSQLIELNNEILIMKGSLDTANLTISSLNSQFSMREEDFRGQLIGIENSSHESAIRYSQDLEIYKEQIRQHALTIVGFEKEISSVRQRETDFLSQIETLKKRIIELEKVSIKKITPPPTPPPKIDSEMLLLEKTIENLRKESSIYSKRIAEQEEIIKVLRRDLITATAKYSDVQSEISEKQKRELEKSKALIHEQTRELSQSRSQLSKLSEIVESQNKQIATFKTDLTKANGLVEKYKLSAEENGNLVLELKAKLDSGQLQLKKYETIKHEEGKITSELTAIGAQCRGERHEQVISRQREALNELRQRVKTLEQSRPLVPAAQQQMQQQVMLLKKQLAEFRANQALTEDISKQASMTRGNDQNLLMIEEKTAHYDTQSALDYSEETYLNLLRSIASMVDLEHIDGLRSMANLPIDERDRLLTARNRAIDTICIKLKDLKESVDRKENLLKDYELDLAKLRQIEFLLQKKSEQLEEAMLDSRHKDDEIELLRESLKNSKSQFDQEKILNSNIKQKKLTGTSMSYERIRKGSTDTLHHHCPPDTDSRIRDAKKTMCEKLKKKDYELKVLKQELRSKHEELSEISNRIKIHENGQDLYS